MSWTLDRLQGSLVERQALGQSPLEMDLLFPHQILLTDYLEMRAALDSSPKDATTGLKGAGTACKILLRLKVGFSRFVIVMRIGNRLEG